jgi:exopolysaccharide biosynthesis protein
MSKKISKEEFDKETKRYKEKHPDGTHGVTMDRASFERILAHPGVTHVHLANALDDAGKHTLAAIGMDAKGNLIAATAENRGGLCPPNCPPTTA